MPPRQCSSRHAYKRSGRNVLTLQGCWVHHHRGEPLSTSCWKQPQGLCDKGVRSYDAGVREQARIQALPLLLGMLPEKRG